ncbi:50S ribosomal protein L35 [Olsenella sp. YH-ols2217]|uniref:Large ribosomal subunit protein bL35 n=1 Tax=Kribbibacterium absianum TaxID=3044210 RepID=A0ABT6ZMU1_9ACTN|nr:MULTISPECIES: 50S ribosomal protein L35 [unclassified Olsenella]MDJ1122174.1 50S ribosomal protein L35 [Olsenella sp. YH-ols2216]MDJ1130182.1 50S ribosomal protein L35 [Olsenella sp. YH-ols2217]
MPKMKTHKGTAKRFRRTGTGKIMRARAFKSHILTKKSPKRIRNFRKEEVLDKADVKTVEQRMGKGRQ